jgi:hypothetical protein
MRNFRFFAARMAFASLFVGITLLQLISFHGQFQHMRRTQGLPLVIEVALTFIVGLWLLCGQVALFCLWRIVEAMKEAEFYARKNYVWIERLLWAFKFACVMPVALFIIIAPQADDPGFLVLLSIVTLFIFSLAITTSLLMEQIKSRLTD